MSKLENASVLAFERKLDPSDALFYAGQWEERTASQRCPMWKYGKNRCAAPSPTA
ncbi:type I-F CRISPR-associated protein Cas7f/Csy3 [Aquitalea magnusonii]|uniref:type I-F CRISPR-associated protein Cas7f/Csy3 n=1 Tax=Aquitalea magnusonii TaxID=332411 RepID=UPI000AC37E0A|nr:type I-F CRISPR-associated protein Cas7f/Csy3 [Aquitalea magnusonii]